MAVILEEDEIELGSLKQPCLFLHATSKSQPSLVPTNSCSLED